MVSALIEFIDSIDDLEKKQQAMFKYSNSKQRNAPTNHTTQELKYDTYDFKDVLDQVNKVPTPLNIPTIQDLQNEICTLKIDI